MARKRARVSVQRPLWGIQQDVNHIEVAICQLLHVASLKSLVNYAWLQPIDLWVNKTLLVN